MPFERTEADVQKKVEAEFEDREKPEEMTKPYETTVTTQDYMAVGEWNYLDQFYKRYNKVLLDKMALDNEKAKLLKENQDLRIILQVFFCSIYIVLNR